MLLVEKIKFLLVNLSFRLYIPENAALRSSVLQRYHDAPASGHHALLKTLRKIDRLYYWPGLRLDVKSFIQTCEVCQR